MSRWIVSLAELLFLKKEVGVDDGLTDEEFDRLLDLSPEEREWKDALLDSVIKEELILHPEDLTIEELKKFIFMQPGEENEWRDKLAQRQGKPSEITVTTAKEHAQSDAKPKFRAARWGERTVSMEMKTLPAVREAVKQIAAANRMTAQEYVEELVVDALNKNPQQVEEGKKRLKQFKGSTVAAKSHGKAEEFAHREAELARREAELARLLRLSSNHTR